MQSTYLWADGIIAEIVDLSISTAPPKQSAYDSC